MQAIYSMGIPFDITTYEEPDLLRLENAYGKDLISVIKKAENINVVSSFSEKNIKHAVGGEGHCININTHPDLFPYYQDYFSKDNSITYCHFPMAKQHIESRNVEYLRRDLRIEEKEEKEEKHTMLPLENRSDNENKHKNKSFALAQHSYENLMKHSTLITNSEFSRRAILDVLDGEPEEVHVISPPVEVEIFRNRVLFSSSGDKRRDIILVVSRIHKSKQIENALKLARLLKQDNIGSGMKIIGNMTSEYDSNYYISLNQMMADLGLERYVTFETNVSLSGLLSYMREAKIYFHPMVGEHFGMSVVESMTAGLVPVVPDIGGPTEFVPKKYQFNSLEEAADKILSAFQISDSERIQISNSVNGFSLSNYVKEFQKVVRSLFPE
jgi:glycosyltransferase involved in cell wall biosynthesis